MPVPLACRHPPLIKSCVAFAHTQFYSGVTVKILLRALCAGLAISSLPAMASVTYQDIVSAATNPDDLSRQGAGHDIR